MSLFSSFTTKSRFYLASASTASAAGLLYSLSQGTRHQSTAAGSSKFILREPPRTAPRQVPTPLAFVSASAWDKESARGMTALSSMFAEKGFMCMEIDLSSPRRDGTRRSSKDLMAHFEKELASHLRFGTVAPSPFPPIIFSRSHGALIAQTYISSHPASGLVLMSPPPLNASVEGSLLPTPLEEFDYEVKFPVAVVGTKGELERIRSVGRLGSDAVDIIEVESLDGQEAFVKIDTLLDDWGV